MSIFSKKQNIKSARDAVPALVLDFGSQSVKALACLYHTDGVEVVSGAQCSYPDGAFNSDGVLQARLVAEALRPMLSSLRTADAAYTPGFAVVGIGGLGVEGYTSQINYRRAVKDRVISNQEFKSILQKVEDRAGQIMTGMIAWETASGADAGLINSEVLDLSLDGYGIESPVDLKGERLSFIVYNAYIDGKNLAAIVGVIKLLGLELASVTSSMYAVLRALVERHGQGLSAAVLEIGGKTTEVGVIRGGRIVGHQGIDVAGQSFTYSIVSDLGQSFADAEVLKLGFAAGKLSGDVMEDIREIVANDCKVFTSGVELVLKEIPGAGNASSKIFVSGGGALLPGIVSTLQSQPLAGSEEKSFPVVESLLPRDVRGFRDMTGRLNSTADVAPVAVATDAIDIVAQLGARGSFWRTLVQR